MLLVGGCSEKETPEVSADKPVKSVSGEVEPPDEDEQDTKLKKFILDRKIDQVGNEPISLEDDFNLKTAKVVITQKDGYT